MERLFFVLILCISLLYACGGDTVGTPKPRAYPKVIYPEKSYQVFEADYCDFSFEYPIYARIQQDTNFFDEAPAHPCWFDLFFPDFDSRLYCTYYPIGTDKSFEELKSDAFELASWHNKKADYIDEIRIEKDNHVSGFAFVIQGAAASPFQFYLTDSTDHFLRGSLYFNAKVQPDSLAPIYDFVEEDLLKLIETFEWEQ
jgi:gliding motility-associated lipoprotein GldD